MNFTWQAFLTCFKVSAQKNKHTFGNKKFDKILELNNESFDEVFEKFAKNTAQS